MSEDPYPKPKMEPKAFGMFSEWYVQVTWPSGHKERVQAFTSEAHARGWIEKESEAWLAESRGPRR
jgi:hypothetical protein